MRLLKPCLLLSIALPLQAAHWPLESQRESGLRLQGEATVVTGVQGRALLLDGHSALELAGTAATGSAGDFTFSVWCNPLRLGDGQRMIAAKNRYRRGEREWGVMVDADGRFRLYLQQKGWQTVTAKTKPQAGHWHQIVVVRRAQTMELWVNGVLEGQAVLKEPLPITEAPVTLGGVLDDAPRQTFAGALDEARLEARALSPAELAALHHPATATLPVPEPIEKAVIWDEQKPVPKAADLPRLQNLRFSVIKPYEFKRDGYRFLHGVGLAFHKGRLYASFGHNRGGENTDTEEARFAVSDDQGRSWSSVITMDDGGPEFAVSHGVFLSHQGTLWAFMGAYTGTMTGIHTRAYRLNEANGSFEKLGRVIEGGFWPMQEPIRMEDGNWILAGIVASGDAAAGGTHPAAVAISRGDNLLKWDLVRIPLAPGLGKVWGESTVIVEGRRITNLSRYGAEAHALVAASEDYGRTWTPMRPSNLPMATSKPYAGRLSTGQRYLIGSSSADGGGRRAPLTIAVSRPGETRFSQVLVRHALFPEGPGESHERASLSYPYAIEHEGHIYVGYSNNGGHAGRIGSGRELWNNNSAELAVIPIAELTR
jgi:hypothetical protein